MKIILDNVLKIEPKAEKIAIKTDLRDSCLISFEGILYDIAFNVIHRFWNHKLSWKFLKSTIQTNWNINRVIGEDQKRILLSNIYSSYIQIRKIRQYDVVLDVQRKFTIFHMTKRLDCLLFRQGQYIIRDVKASISNNKSKYRYQLAIYALGVEKYRKLRENTVNVGELLSVDPFRLITINLREKKKQIIDQILLG